jgi:formyltetrahydrofolate deformylase
MAEPQPQDEQATLLVSCPDQKGIVATLAQTLYGLGINIIDADQHTDQEASTFFQRIHFDMAGMHVDARGLESAIGEVAARFHMRWRLAYGRKRKQVAIMVSKQDHCLHDLLWRHRAGELRCDIPLVISNHPDLADLARQNGSEFHVLPITKETKAEQEQAIAQLLQTREIDVVILARYMQIVSSELCEAYSERMINIHHSFLPAFVGGNPYRQANQRGVKLIGATSHYVTADLDQGPIIEQDVVRVSHRDSVRDMIRKGRDLERIVLARAVRSHLEDRVLVYGNKTVVFD